MKKVFLAICAASFVSLPAFAEQLSQAYETEDGALTSQEVSELKLFDRNGRNESRWDDEDYGNGGWNRPGHGGHGREFVCFAQNRRGQIFRAVGYRPRAVQARAIDKCYRESRQCRPMGCRVRH